MEKQPVYYSADDEAADEEDETSIMSPWNKYLLCLLVQGEGTCDCY